MTTLIRPPGELSDAELQAEIEALARAGDVEARRDPVSLARHLRPRVYRLRPHLRVIGDAFRDITAHVTDRLMIFTPPQVGKSETTAVWGVFWYLVHNPGHRVVVACYSNKLALKRGRSVRALVVEYGERFGLKLARGAQQAQDWTLTTGGGMLAVGIEGGLTGHDAHLLVIDDPHKDRAEAASAAIREHVWDWWTSTARTRLQPGSAAVIIMTRWHPDDLAGRLIDQFGTTDTGGLWRVIRMPAIADSDDDPLGRAPGEPLPHPKVRTADRAALMTHWDAMRLELGPRDWGAMCQADPQPNEGALLSWEELRAIRRWGAVPPAVRAAVAVDPSGGGRDTAGIIGGVLTAGGELYYTHDVSGVMGTDEWARAACQLAVEIDADKVVVETNFGGDMGMMLVRTAWELLRRDHDAKYPGTRNPYRQHEDGSPRLPPAVVAVRAKKNKLLRAEPVAAQARLGRLFTGAHLPEFETEWATWQPTDPDSPGRIDAGVYLAYALLEVPGSEMVVASAARVSRAAVASRGGGLSRSALTGGRR